MNRCELEAIAEAITDETRAKVGARVDAETQERMILSQMTCYIGLDTNEADVAEILTEVRARCHRKDLAEPA
ncbi:MAG: hypothetical protein HY460_00140 [Parcubacteria group bacterium]|nr:hypothetical protein [Parcubacteria group bacterium]